jgi:hypothetical protein
MEIKSPRVPVHRGPYQLTGLENQNTPGRKDAAIPFKTDSTVRKYLSDAGGNNITGAQTVSGNDVDELKISANRFGHVPLRG